MMLQQGEVDSLQELGEHFLDFVQRSNETTDAWEVIDDRLDSFYGATIKFPVSDNFRYSEFSNVLNKQQVKVFNLMYNVFVPDVQYYCDGRNFIAKSRSVIGNMDSFYRSGGPYVINNSSDYLCYYAYELPQVVSEVEYHLDAVAYNYFINSDDGPKNFNFNVIFDDFDNKHSFGVAIDTYNLNDELSSLLQDVDICFVHFPIYSFQYLFDGERDCANFIRKFLDSIKDYFNSIGVSMPICAWGVFVANCCDVSGEVPRYNSYVDTMISDLVSTYSNLLGNYYCKFFNGYSASTPSGTINANNATQLVKMMSYPKLSAPVELRYINLFNNIAPTSEFVSDLDSVISDSIDNNTIINYIGFNNSRIDVLVYMLYIFRRSDGRLSIRGNNYLEYVTGNGITEGYYAYISLQFNKITSTTYNDWLTNTKDHYMSETYNSNRLKPVWYNGGISYERTTISNVRQNDIANIFKDTGEVLFISPHIKYDRDLWMAEQGGIACDYETLNQNIEDNCIRAMHLTYPIGGGNAILSWHKLPPFPSLGCPMFTISDKQLAMTADTVSEKSIHYYFVRNNTSASIVIYAPLASEVEAKYGVQHMSFGCLDCFSISEQFKFPLYVAGGNGALDKEYWRYSYPGSAYPNHEVGNIYTLDMSNISLSNSNILLSTKFNGANVTNFRVLTHDGHWDNIFNVVQNCKLVVDPDVCNPDAWTSRYYIYQEPSVGGSELGDLRYGGTTLDGGVSNIKKIDTHLINTSRLELPSVSMSTNEIVSNTPVTPVIPVFSSHKVINSEIWPRHRYGILGKIPYCYSTWSRYLKFGEVRIANKRFLAIPNAFDNRYWWTFTRTSLGFSTLNSQIENLYNLNNKFYNSLIYDYLLLRLED